MPDGGLGARSEVELVCVACEQPITATQRWTDGPHGPVHWSHRPVALALHQDRAAFELRQALEIDGREESNLTDEDRAWQHVQKAYDLLRASRQERPPEQTPYHCSRHGYVDRSHYPNCPTSNATVIDAQEFEDAMADPKVAELHRRADEYAQSVVEPAELSPAHALQAARAMEFAETHNQRPDLYVFGAEFREARELLERLAEPVSIDDP